MRKSLITIGTILLLMAVGTMISPVSAQSQNVCRSLPSGDVAPGSIITVSLAATVDNTTYMSIHEIVPSGWTVISASDGGDFTTTAGNVFWVITSNATNKTYTYTVQVPSDASGTYTFSGTYMMEGMASNMSIECDTQVAVEEGQVPQEQNVCRSLPSGDVAPGSVITVSLAATVDNATYMSIHEIVPSGWTVISASDGGDFTTTAGNIFWVITSNATDKTYTYTVQVPSDASGTYTFSGMYMMEGMTSHSSIDCDTYVTVEEAPSGIVLEKGWNFFSVPCVLNNDTVEYVLDGIDYEIITWYDASSQNWYIPIDIVPMTAYCILVNETQVIENIECTSKIIVPPSRQMYAGWNPVGLTGFIPKTAEFTFYAGDIDNNYNKVWGPWDPSVGIIQHGYNQNVFGDIPGGESPDTIPSDVYTENFMMKPYEGHWIYMTSDAVLSAIA